MRVCRIARQYPRASQPGALLAAYILSEQMPFPCLYIAKVLDGPPIVTFSAHVTPLFISYPEPTFPEGYNITKLQTLMVAAGKAAGALIFTLKAIPHILKFKPDIVHVHTPLPIGPALWAKAFLRKPVVLTFHGTDFYRFQRSRALQWVIKKFVDYVMCITPEMVTEFNALLPQIPAVYIANGVDLSMFAPGDSQKKKQIVTVGRLTWQKGYADLIRAMAKVIKAEPEYRLVIVGDGSLKDELKAVAEEAGIADKVEFTGMLPQPQVVEILRQSELYVMSSNSEGFPKALLEAMACGLPLVVTDVGACGMLAKDAGLVVPHSQPDQLADALVTMLQNPEMRKRCADQALKTAEQYRWETVTHNVQAIYESLVNKQPSARSVVSV